MELTDLSKIADEKGTNATKISREMTKDPLNRRAVYNILNDLGRPTFDQVNKVVRHLGYELALVRKV